MQIRLLGLYIDEMSWASGKLSKKWHRTSYKLMERPMTAQAMHGARTVVAD